MKLPKNFGGGGAGIGGMMQQMQQAMERAKQLEDELADERIVIDKGPIKATFAGTAELVSIKIDKNIVDPDDVEMLEDMIVSAVRDGFNQATESRQKKVDDITKGTGLPF